jgi:acyl dehydratase
VNRYFDDFGVGDTFQSGGLTLSEAMLLDFAMKYDPQPFHLDVEAAKQSIYGGLIASGCQTLAVALRLFLSERVLASCSLGSPGIEEIRYKKPVRPGDTLSVKTEILEKNPSRSRTDRGVLRIGYMVTNQNQEPVLTAQILHLVLKKGHAGE